MAYDKQEPTPSTSRQQSPGMIGSPHPAPQSSTCSRAVNLVAKALPATVALSIGVVVVNAVLPQPLKLTTLAGKFMAEMHVTETLNQQDVVVENQRRMADAQAAAQARWEMERAVFEKQQQAIYDAMQGKVALANAADWTCNLGPFGVALFYQQGSRDARDANQLVRQACAYAVQLRQEIVSEQAELARIGSAIQQRQNAGGMR